ncbi:glucose PTS transporter subunit IIA [Pseudolactococcus laudensis]|uniref:glucose PTS transporter subunit IIA n=1 Tax=Pseudolactococcus laudensis TaxID=1494461 RepID=UPI002FCB7058
MLGITEPAMFGVNLKLKFPFFIGLGAAGIASTIMGFAGVRGVSLGPAGIIGFIAIKPASIPMFMLGIVVSFVLAFLATYVYGRGRMDVPANVASTGTTAQEINIVKTSEGVSDEALYAPVTGQAIQLSETKDKVFSSELMGKGIAIEPTIGEIYAPADGTLIVTNDSKHAYVFLTNNGAEVLLHIGIDTVQMAGEGFSTQVKQGQVVKKGDLLGTFDISKIKANGYEATVMVIVTNTMSFAEVQGIDNQTVTVGQAVIQTTAPVTK